MRAVIAMYGSRKILTHDHEALDMLLAEYVAARGAEPPDPEERTACWQAFCRALRRHAEIEEQILFPAYAANVRPSPGGPFDALKMQHREIFARLEALERGAWTDPLRLQRESELMDLLWKHEAQEEGLFLPWMLACLNEAERALLHERMDTAQMPGPAKIANG